MINQTWKQNFNKHQMNSGKEQKKERENCTCPALTVEVVAAMEEVVQRKKNALAALAGAAPSVFL